MTKTASIEPRRTERAKGAPADVTRRLLDSAITVFAERGYEAATVASIARKSGFTTGAIFSRWLTKREMFIAAVEHVAAQRMEHLAAADASGAANGLRHLAIGAGLRPNGSDSRDHLWIEACVVAAHDPELREIIGDLLEDEAGALAKMVADAKSAVALDPALDTDAIVVLLQAADLGLQLVRRAQNGHRDLPSDDCLDALMSRCFSGLARR